MSRVSGLWFNLQVQRGHPDTKPSRASCSGQATATQFVVVASILPAISSVYMELMAKDASGNFLWETQVRDGLNDTPRLRSRWWENKRQDGERRPRSPLPPPAPFFLPASFTTPLSFCPHCCDFFFHLLRSAGAASQTKVQVVGGLSFVKRLDTEPLTMVSRPMGAEKTHSSWKTTASAWWLASRSSKLLRRPSVCGRGDADELYGWNAAVVRKWGTQMSDSCFCWKLPKGLELCPKMWQIYFTQVKVLK